MAAWTAVFKQLNVKQTEILVRQRQLKGAHCYYTQVYDVNVAPANIEFPGFLNKDSVFTAVYEYTKPYTSTDGDTYQINFSKPLSGKSYYVGIAASHRVIVWVDGNSRDTLTNEHIKTQKGGLHVVQCTIQESSFVAFIDGEQMIPTGKLKTQALQIEQLLTGNSGKEPFALWETHFTTPNPTVGFDRHFGFPHNGFKMGFGSYIEFHGTWTTDRPTIKDGGRTLAELDTTGTAVLTLNVYPNMSTVSNGPNDPLVKELPSKSEISLGKITCNKPSELHQIIVVVGDYGK